MKQLLVSILLLQFIFHVSETLNPEIRHEAFLDPVALLNMYNYPGEAHNVTTKDGYILTVHRIPSKAKNAVPILLIPRLGCESVQFFMTGNNSPAFILADAKFDVWIGNLRGNQYTSHVKYKYQDDKFWDFGLDEMAEHDLPSIIDFVLHVTNRPKLVLTAESQGSIIAFAMLASQPKYNEKVAHYFATAPIWRTIYMPSLVIKLSTESSKRLNFTSPRHFPFIQGETLTLIMDLISKLSKIDPFIVDMTFGLTFGYDPYLYNRTRLPIYFAHCRYSLSLKLYQQVIQFHLADIPRKYDYGETKNMQVYNSPIPPVYDVSTVTVPITIFQGTNDIIADPLDVELLSRQLRTLKHRVALPFASHFDPTIAMNLRELMYDKFVAYLKDVSVD